MTDTPRLDLPLIDGEQALKHVTHNEALALLDAIVQLAVIDIDLTVPPGSPLVGDAWLVGTAATGAWSGHDAEIAAWTEGGWRFIVPLEGWLMWNAADQSAYVLASGGWEAIGAHAGPLQNLALLGVNTTADATNKLAVASNAVLFDGLGTGSGGTGDLRLALNKEAAGNTGSLVFQTGFSGRAEIGLTGSDDFAFKVSADGASFQTGFSLAAATGFVRFNQVFGTQPSFSAIAGGALTVTTSYAVPAPETGTSDDLDTIAGGEDGALLILSGTAGNAITVKDSTGNLKLGADRVLDNFEDTLLLVKRGSDWLELSFANNG